MTLNVHSHSPSHTCLHGVGFKDNQGLTLICFLIYVQQIAALEMQRDVTMSEVDDWLKEADQYINSLGYCTEHDLMTKAGYSLYIVTSPIKAVLQ